MLIGRIPTVRGDLQHVYTVLYVHMCVPASVEFASLSRAQLVDMRGSGAMARVTGLTTMP